MADLHVASDAELSVNGGNDQVLGARSIDVVEMAYEKEQKDSDPVEEIGSASSDLGRGETSEEPSLANISETSRRSEDLTFNIEQLRDQVKAKDSQIKDLQKEIEERDITIARQNVELGRRPFSESEGLRDRKLPEEKEELKATIGKLEDDIGILVDGKIDLENRLKSKKNLQYGLTGLVIILVLFIAFLLMYPQNSQDIKIYKEKYDRLSVEIQRLGIINDQLKNDSSKVTADLNDCKAESDEINVHLRTEQQVKSALEEEKKKLETEQRGLQDELTEITGVKTVLEQEMNTLETKKKELEDELTNLDARLKTSNMESHKKIDKLLTDLSECRTINDKDRVTESDLEPIKLGEQFRTIYEQHYTMAIDELEEQHGSQDVKETVQKFLDILKAAHTMTEKYSKRHIESMNTSITSLQIDKPDASAEGGKIPVFVNSTLSMFDLKNFYEIRQKCAWRMLDSVAKELGDMIARQFNINPESQPKMMTYIRSCVSLCWKTNMHREPVYIDFSEPGTREEFDYETFKPFLYPTGNYMDYVVWPPMYVHKRGKMIAKGIAERKE